MVDWGLTDDGSGALAGRAAMAARMGPSTASPANLVDTTMLFAPRSGGVKRYLLAKHRWAAGRSELRHTILIPGAKPHGRAGGVMALASPRLPFGDGYRCPTNLEIRKSVV